MIITIGRQLGSGGRETGKLLAQEFGMAYYDRELLAETARESGMSHKILEAADERARKSNCSTLLGLRFPFLSDSHSNQGLTDEMLFQIQSDVIRTLAERSPSVFIGRCADYILRDRTDLISIFISANDDDRIRRVMQHEGCTVEKAREMIEKADRRRAAYYNFYTNKTWGAAASYDLCFNSSKMPLEAITSMLKEKL